METAVTILLGVLTIAMAAHGGFLTSASLTHRRIFAAYALIALVLVVTQGVLAHRGNAASSRDRAALVEQIKELRGQISTFLGVIRLQATLDDIRGIQSEIRSGFVRVESAMKGAGARSIAMGPKAEPKAEPPAQPMPAPSPPRELPSPPVVEHVRFTQRRAPSNKAEAPYGLQIIIQTDTVIQPAGFRIECDGEIFDWPVFLSRSSHDDERRNGIL